MHQRLVLLCLLLTCSSLLVTAQNIKWSEDLDINSYQRVVAAHENGDVFIQRFTRGGFFDSNIRSELIKIDAKDKPTHLIEVDDLEEQRYIELEAIETDKGVAIVYLTTDSRIKGHYLVSAQLYSHEDLQPLEVYDFLSVPARTHRASVTAYRNGNTNALFDIDISEDRSKLLVMYTEEWSGSNRETYVAYSVIDLANGMEISNAGKMYSEQRSTKTRIHDFAVNNKGDVVILVKQYKDNRDYEFFEKERGYDYVVYVEPQGDKAESYVLDVPIKKYYADEMRVAISDNGSYYVSGMLRDKPYQDVVGYYFLQSDPDGNIVHKLEKKYTQREVEKVRLKKKQKLTDLYNIIDLRTYGDKVYAVSRSEQLKRFQDIGMNDPFFMRRRFYRSNLDRNNRYEIRKGNIVIQAFDTVSGKQDWLAVNPRSNRDDEINDLYYQEDVLISDKGLTLIYNENPKNLERRKEGKKLSMYNLRKIKSSVVSCTIDNAGKTSYEILSDKDYYYILQGGVLKSGDDILLLASKRNRRDSRLGRLGW